MSIISAAANDFCPAKVAFLEQFKALIIFVTKCRPAISESIPSTLIERAKESVDQLIVGSGSVSSPALLFVCGFVMTTLLLLSSSYPELTNLDDWSIIGCYEDQIARKRKH